MSEPLPIPRLDEESEPAWAAFLAWAKLGPGRTYPAATEALGRPPSYTRQIKKWAKSHRWRQRVAAWDQAELVAERKGREAAREAAYRLLYKDAPAAAERLVELSEGKHSPGSRPSVQLQATIQILAQAGMVPPKRTELVVDADDGLDPAREVMSAVTVAQLAQILALPDEADGEP